MSYTSVVSSLQHLPLVFREDMLLEYEADGATRLPEAILKEDGELAGLAKGALDGADFPMQRRHLLHPRRRLRGLEIRKFADNCSALQLCR